MADDPSTLQLLEVPLTEPVWNRPNMVHVGVTQCDEVTGQRRTGALTHVEGDAEFWNRDGGVLARDTNSVDTVRREVQETGLPITGWLLGNHVETPDAGGVPDVGQGDQAWYSAIIHDGPRIPLVRSVPTDSIMPVRSPSHGARKRKRDVGYADGSGMDQTPETNGTPPLHSIYEDDLDLRDLVIRFVEEMDQRVETIRSAFLSEDVVALQRISHQLKGAAGGYGFDSIGDSAARLEYDLLTDEAMISDLSERVEDLISSCRAAVRPGDS